MNEAKLGANIIVVVFLGLYQRVVASYVRFERV